MESPLISVTVYYVLYKPVSEGRAAPIFKVFSFLRGDVNRYISNNMCVAMGIVLMSYMYMDVWYSVANEYMLISFVACPLF